MLPCFVSMCPTASFSHSFQALAHGRPCAMTVFLVKLSQGHTKRRGEEGDKFLDRACLGGQKTQIRIQIWLGSSKHVCKEATACLTPGTADLKRLAKGRVVGEKRAGRGEKAGERLACCSPLTRTVSSPLGGLALSPFGCFQGQT